MTPRADPDRIAPSGERVLAALGRGGRYAARVEHGARIDPGRVSVQALPDAGAAIRFAFHVIPLAYGETAF